MPRYEFSDGSSNKFWEITLTGSNFVASWGKIGTAGQSKPQSFGSPEAAKKEYDKLVAEKTKKGYTLVSGGSAPAAAPKPTAPAKGKPAAAAPAPAAPVTAAAPAGKGRRFEFKEDGSAKFWEIELEEESFTARWGKIGTAGQEKTQDFDSKKDARIAADKLIAEKVKKGYQEVGGGGGGGASLQWNPEFEATILKNPDDAKGYLVYADWLQSNGNPLGELVALQNAKTPNPKAEKALIKEHLGTLFGEDAVEAGEDLKLTWKNGFVDSIWIGGGYETHGDLAGALDQILASPAARFVRSITVGLLNYDDGEPTAQDFINTVVKRAPKLLSRFEAADFEYPDQTEMSWAHTGDVKKLWAAVPSLREVVLRGGGTLDFGTIDAPELTSFTVETGGLPPKSLKAITSAKWPKLETLKVWLGQENYGFESDVKDLQPIFDAKGLGNLRHLGLMNAEIVEEIVPALAKAKVLKQLETLDLSMGTLSEAGAKAFVDHAGAFKHLKKINLADNILVAAELKQLKALGLNFEFGKQREFEPEYRYSAVGE